MRLAAVPGSAAELAHHYLASHDIPGAFCASVRAGREAERLAAPAEAHRHFDQALALWDRVNEPEKLAGVDRGWLAYDSAENTAGSGDVVRAVHELRRLLDFVTAQADPVLVGRAGERLAYFLLETDDAVAAANAAEAAVDVLPADPPRWERARALATHAQTLLYTQDEATAVAKAEQAREAARAAAAPWVEADALVTLGLLDERAGRTREAIARFTMANRQALDAGVLGVQLRASFQLSRTHLERGDLAESSKTAHEGLRLAEQAGLGLAPYGLDLKYRTTWRTTSTVTGSTRCRSPTASWCGSPTSPRPGCRRWPCSSTLPGAAPRSPSGWSGCGRSGPPTGSARTLPAGCWPSICSGRVTPRQR